ncbi:hypothetical protein Bbelb_438950 [Branchiostoma belcheri]|nr:hypothetical protein Bbelb_438950 [Branchiostoma belcheri]
MLVKGTNSKPKEIKLPPRRCTLEPSVWIVDSDSMETGVKLNLQTSGEQSTETSAGGEHWLCDENCVNQGPTWDLFYDLELSARRSAPGDTITNMTGGGLPEVNPGTQPARSLQHGTAAENTLPPHKLASSTAALTNRRRFPDRSLQVVQSFVLIITHQSELPGAVVSDVWPRAGCYSLSVIPEQKCPADVCKGRFKHGVIAMATGTPGDVTYALFAESSAAFL